MTRPRSWKSSPPAPDTPRNRSSPADPWPPQAEPCRGHGFFLRPFQANRHLRGPRQSRTCPVSQPAARTWPSGENTTAWTLPERPCSTPTSWAAAILQSRTLRSQLPDASVLPSGANDRVVTRSWCVRGRFFTFPVAISHRRMARSFDPVASRRASGEKAPHRTGASPSAPNVASSSPVLPFRNWTCPPRVVARCLPSGVKATHSTPPGSP
jgi:hypothetical protein